MSVQTLKRGFVLHRRDFRNTSLLLELFTAEEGRLACVAKGARSAPRGRSALGALLQPFQPLWLSWVGNGEVKTLTRAEAGASSFALAAERLYCGFYLNELLLRLIDREDPHEALFVFYQQALADLESEPLETVLRRFELRLLEELGYALDLRSDRDGRSIDADRHYRYQPGEGLHPVLVGARAGETSSITGPAEALDVLISGITIERLATGAPLQRSDKASARALMRAALAPHLGPKPLRSRELFRRSSS